MEVCVCSRSSSSSRIVRVGVNMEECRISHGISHGISYGISHGISYGIRNNLWNYYSLIRSILK